jgi:pimeloyl-ACP methyl ester carboxylesterase
LHDVKVEKFSPQGMDGNLLHWAHLKFPSANMSVVTIRGTATALDLTVDMTFWTAITSFHQLRLFMPVLSQLPPKYIGRLIRAFFVYGLGGAPDTIYKPIIEYTRKLRTLSSEKILVVGHSLGGGIASVVASRVDGVQGFGLSPSGVFYNSLAFGFDPVYTYESFTAIIPDNDPVPIEGDKVIGMIQQIPCTANAAVCHNLNQSLVTVVKGCKDYSNPNRIWDIPGYFSKEIDLQVDPWQWKIKAEDYTAEIGEKYERSRWKAGRD